MILRVLTKNGERHIFNIASKYMVKNILKLVNDPPVFYSIFDRGKVEDFVVEE
jgi:hypothetical protein